MLDTEESTDIDFQLIVLEELFSEECKCEFNHVTSVCTGKVTHRVIQCTHAVNVCSVGVSFAEAKMATTNVYSCFCGKEPVDCWKIVAI